MVAIVRFAVAAANTGICRPNRILPGKPPQYFTEPPGQLSLLPSPGREVSTGQSAVMLIALRLGYKGRMAHSIRGQRCGWRVKLCDPSLTRAIPERFRDEYHTRYKALYNCPAYLLTLLTDGVLRLSSPAEI